MFLEKSLENLRAVRISIELLLVSYGRTKQRGSVLQARNHRNVFLRVFDFNCCNNR